MESSRDTKMEDKSGCFSVGNQVLEHHSSTGCQSPASANAGQPAFQQLQGSGQPVTQPKIVAPQNMQHVAGDNPDDDLPF